MGFFVTGPYENARTQQVRIRKNWQKPAKSVFYPAASCLR